MPTMPPTFRRGGPVSRSDQRKVHDGDRSKAQPWRKWYGTARWKALRIAQLRREPICRLCDKAGFITAATVCDHVERHNGDPIKFWTGPFQSLCEPCHNGPKQSAEKTARRRRTTPRGG